MRITKMHGAGNDFIIINNIEARLSPEALSALASKLCAFHTSVGADGLMAVCPAQSGGDYAMLFFNSDGSAGEMCGNGARCIARYGHDNGLAGEVQHIETPSGLVIGRRISQGEYRVRLNDASLIDIHRRVSIGGAEYDCAYVELGTPGLPHAVVELPGRDLGDLDALRPLGRALRHAGEFPRGANVTFVQRLSPRALRAVTFERGVEDFTLACGTGCGATVAALTLRGALPSGEVSIAMPGGTLSVSARIEGGLARDILLTGPAVTVFEGELIDE